MNVLIACEFSGIVRDAFAARGHNAVSCDLIPSEGFGKSIVGDVEKWLGENIINRMDGWDLMIAHPPCTYLSNSGVSWLHKDATRWLKMFEGAEFFWRLLHANIPKIAVENPIMHKYARRLIGAGPTQIIQPWMFGHRETKATCLWLKDLPPLKPTSNLRTETMNLPANQRQRLHYLPPSADRGNLRSKTFSGIANAMAEQWG